jgi:amino acid adenylation domain-containing protein
VIRSDRRRGFEPARPPLWRVTLAAGPGERWDLVWSIHHLLLDGWSMAGVLAEVLRDYARFRHGGTAAPTGPQVGDYLAWSADHPPPDGAEHFARDLAGCYEEPAHWRWPEARESGDVDPFGEIAFALDARQTGALERVARDERLTISTVLCGAWSVVLAERQRRERVVIGVTTSGREAEVPGLEEMVGVFINTLPVSVQPDAERPAAEWLRSLQSKLAHVRTYERCDLSEIRRWAGVRGDAHLFDSAVIVDTYPIERVAGTSVEGIEIEDVRFLAPGGLPVVLKVHPTDTLRVVIKYDRRSVGDDEIRGYSEDLSRLLGGFAEDPSRALRDLGRAPAGSGAPPVVAPRARLTHVAVAIAEAAASCPEATAVRDGERALSYRALDRMSDAIAAFLIDRGVERDTLVALCMERSAHYPAAMLGVWKAGGAFVPIEMGLPPERLHSLLAADALAMALADAASLEKLRSAPLPVFGLDDAIGTEARPAARPDRGELDPASLAYCVFTSGSTGTPKAVAVEHAQLAHYTGAACAALGVAPGDELACVTTLAADLGYTMLFPALASGACVTIIDERDALDPWKLARRFAANPVDHLKIVPTLLGAWLAEDVGRQLLPARTLVLGGETFPWALRDRLIGLDLGCRILNHYGPTETTIGVVCGPADDADREMCPSVPLGPPLGDARLRLSGEAAAPDRHATDGELEISGPCVARGYLDAPELQRERFGAGTEEGRRYRTGDRVRRLADGRLVFLGRDDDQVKIRGHRVELGDVESCLRTLPGVAQAAVLLETSELGDARLAAFVAGDALSAESIRAQLENKLPAVMVPGRVSVLPRLPVTPNGKVDRRALLSTDRPDDVEGRVHAIWQGLFPGQEVARDANFYDLGGQSLLALRMVSRIRRELDVELPVGAIFDQPTIGALVRYIHELGARAPSERAPAEADHRAGGADRVYRLSPTQAEMWQAAQRDRRLDQSQTTLELRGALERSAFEAALRAVVSHHPVLRTSFERGPNGAPLQRVHARVPVELEWEDWREATSEEREWRWHELVRGNETIGFDLESAPLFRLTVLRIAEELYWAHWHVHHILSDGWSADVVCADLLACYEAIRRGDDVPIAEWPGFERYVEWLGSADAAEAELFWRKQLAGLEPPALTAIDADRVPSDADGAYAGYADRLEARTRDELRGCAQALHVMPSTLVHASWALALHGLTGRGDVAFGTVTAGRPPDLTDVERIVGPFLAATPFRVVIDPEASVAEWLRSIHEALIHTMRFGFVDHRSLRAWAGREQGAALADSLLVVQGSHSAAVLRHAGTLRVDGVRSPWGRTQSALFVEVVPDSGEVTAVWRTDRFREQTVAKLLALHKRALSRLSSLARDPGSRLASVLER